jgi:agmatinase
VVIRKPSTDAFPRGGEGIIRHGWASFFGAPVLEDVSLLKADVAFLGVPFDAATNDRPGARFGPAAVRDASVRYQSPGAAGWLDPERGVHLLRGVRMLDAGDVDIRTVDLMENFDRMTEAARLVRASGAFPVFIGGDHAITFALVRAFDNPAGGKLTVVQFDAHQDFTDEKFGVRYSHDNHMRRTSELPHVGRIVQVGIRSLIERPEPWEAALAMGVQIIPSERIVRLGAEAALADLQVEGDCYLTIDIDVLDPATAPGTGYPEPGGLSYYQLREAVWNVLRRCRLVGFDVTEVNPVYDSTGATARIAARLILDVLGEAEGPPQPAPRPD